MRETILRVLGEIESREGVRILHAVESGSRAWGFPSPDSDYDVRFFYVHPRDWYLSLEKRRDVLEGPMDGRLDVAGWDLDKTLRLLHKSNPTLFEWSRSPVVYRTTEVFRELLPVMDACFTAKAGLWHYWSMAWNNCREFLQGRERVRAKKYLYVLRPLLACRWILERGTPPPMEFARLVESQLEPALRPAVEELVRRKRELPETGWIPPVTVLDRWMEEEFLVLKGRIQALPPEEPRGWEELNRLFLRALEAA